MPGRRKYNSVIKEEFTKSREFINLSCAASARAATWLFGKRVLRCRTADRWVNFNAAYSSVDAPEDIGELFHHWQEEEIVRRNGWLNRRQSLWKRIPPIRRSEWHDRNRTCVTWLFFYFWSLRNKTHRRVNAVSAWCAEVILCFVALGFVLEKLDENMASFYLQASQLT